MLQPQNFEVTLTSLVYGGDAMGRLPDGRAVFVPFALPGETVRVSVVEDRPRHALARLEEILVPGNERINPRCKHFGICGGCHYQHMPYLFQLEAKTAILIDQLRRIGKLIEIPVSPIVPSPDCWYYRNFIRFHISDEGRLGFTKARSSDVIPIEECILPQVPLDGIWPLLSIVPETGIQHVGLRVGDQQDVQIILESDFKSIPEVIVEGFDASVVHVSSSSCVILAGSDHTRLKILDRLFRVSAGSFFQVNTRVAELMVETVMAELPDTERLIVLEIYSGVGLFSAFLANRAERLVSIEVSSQACDDFVHNLNEFDNVELFEAPAEVVIDSLDLKPDVVMVDPPRNGLDRKVLQSLCSMAAKMIIYISCDPATLSRDARYLLDGGYRLSKVIPFDMFPLTYHIESISIWVR
jgi:23S rRNA (uracil1939-C5)-methyltransferase